jgi:hypothetical protein
MLFTKYYQVVRDGKAMRKAYKTPVGKPEWKIEHVKI